MSILNWFTEKKNIEEESGIYNCICGAQISTGLPNSPTWKQMLRDFKKKHDKHNLGRN